MATPDSDSAHSIARILNSARAWVETGEISESEHKDLVRVLSRRKAFVPALRLLAQAEDREFCDLVFEFAPDKGARRG